MDPIPAISLSPHERTWVEINQTALLSNLAQIVTVARGTQIGIVLKGNAYGHGLTLVAQTLEAQPSVDVLLVAGVSEALILRIAGCRKPIVVLSYYDGPVIEAIRQQITLSVASIAMLHNVIIAAQQAQVPAMIHLEVETGLQRTGLDGASLATVMQLLERHPINVQLRGIYTHLCDTNNPDQRFTQEQLEQFTTMAEQLDPHHHCSWHVAASGGLYVPHLFDGVRVGTMLYGSWKSKVQQQRMLEHYPTISLQPALSWKTRIIAIHTVPTGSSLGYDRTVIATKPLRIAVLPVGYSDGYQRALSNRGVVRIHEQYAPIVGIMSMNLMTVDITDITNVEIGDIAILVGPHQRITPAALAEQLNSNPNVITGSINPLIPRLVVREDAV